MFWIFGGALALLATLILIAPVLRRARPVLERADSAMAIFADQLAEVDRDAARGLISGEEAQAARSEIKRRMLAASKAQPERTAPQGRRGAWLLVATALLTPLGGIGLYMLTGSPGVPSLPFAARQGEQSEAAEIAALTDKLRTRLEADEAGGPSDGWMLLGQTYMRMRRFQDAAYAFAKVVERPEATSTVLSQNAEALVAADDGVVTPKAEALLDRALEMDPMNAAATYYKALALEQAGETVRAHGILKARLEAEDGFAPWMEIFVGQANRIGAMIGAEAIDLAAFAPDGPSAEDVAAASEMSDEDREAFIRSMVARLAERLADEPDDLDGWLRLAQAYTVLGEAEKAREAYLGAQALTDALPEDDPRRQAVVRGLEGLGG